MTACFIDQFEPSEEDIRDYVKLYNGMNILDTFFLSIAGCTIDRHEAKRLLSRGMEEGLIQVYHEVVSNIDPEMRGKASAVFDPWDRTLLESSILGCIHRWSHIESTRIARSMIWQLVDELKRGSTLEIDGGFVSIQNPPSCTITITPHDFEELTAAIGR